MNIKHTHLLFDQHIQPEDPKLFHYNHQPFACQGSLGWDSQGSWTFHPLVRLLHTARDRKRVRSCLQKIGYLYPKLMFLSSGVKLVMFLCFQLTGNASVHVSRDNYESSRTPACSMMQSSSKLAQIGTFITYLEWRWCELWKFKFTWRYDCRSGIWNSSNCKFTQKYFRTSMAFQLVWVFIAQLVEYCSTNQEAMGSNPIKVRKFYLF